MTLIRVNFSATYSPSCIFYEERSTAVIFHFDSRQLALINGERRWIVRHFSLGQAWRCSYFYGSIFRTCSTHNEFFWARSEKYPCRCYLFLFFMFKFIFTLIYQGVNTSRLGLELIIYILKKVLQKYPSRWSSYRLEDWRRLPGAAISSLVCTSYRTMIITFVWSWSQKIWSSLILYQSFYWAIRMIHYSIWNKLLFL